MANPKLTAASSVPPPLKAVPRLSHEASTIAAGIYALTVAGELKERIPSETKLKQLSEESIRAARVVAVLLDQAQGGDEDDKVAPVVAPQPNLTTR